MEDTLSMNLIASDIIGTSIASQEAIDEFLDKIITKKPGKVTEVFSPSLYANLHLSLRKTGVVKTEKQLSLTEL